MEYPCGENWSFYDDTWMQEPSPRLSVKGHWSSELDKIVKKYKPPSLFLQRWEEPDLNFLRTVPTFKHLTFGTHETLDTTALNDLESLEYLSLYCPRPQIDFKCLTNLRELKLGPSGLKTNFSDCPWLTTLHLEDVTDLTTLKKLVNLEKLAFDSSKLKSLEGISSLTSLKVLNFASPKWTSLNGLEVAQTLTELRVSHMDALTDIDAVGKLRNLQILSITYCNKLRDITPLGMPTDLRYIDLSDCRIIDSIKPLKSLNNLRVFHFTGNVKLGDGDTSVLLDLPELTRVLFPNWKGVVPSNEDVRDAIRASGKIVNDHAKKVDLGL